MEIDERAPRRIFGRAPRPVFRHRRQGSGAVDPAVRTPAACSNGPVPDDGVHHPLLTEVTRALAAGGCVAAEEEAVELLASARGDAAGVAALVGRRLRGEPLAWITGSTRFCGLRIAVHHGVYVPRWQSEPLARRALALLPEHGAAVDVCTGSGAVAAFLGHGRPAARVVATDVDGRAVACARSNGVEAYEGDLFAPVPADLAHGVDVVVAVVPYVPTPALAFLPHDTLTFESALPYDGGADGTDVLRRMVAASPHWLRLGGALLLETGAGEAHALAEQLERHGFGAVAVLEDDEGDERGIEATFEG